MHRNIPALGLVLLLVLSGCSRKNKAPDVSHISLNVNISRFDHDFLSLDSSHITEGLQQLQKEYPHFLPVYMRQIMNFNYSPDSSSKNQKHPYLKEFITNKDIATLQDTVDAHFPDEKIKHIKEELTQSFKYIKYYFPDFNPPQIVTFISALANYGAITADSVLGIGLDMFLGSDFLLYQKVASPYPEYIRRRFEPKYLIPGCIKVLAQEMYPVSQNGTLLDQMIAHGKLLYFLDKILPQTKDTRKIFYQPQQIQWCRENEAFIWQYFIKNQLLYKKNSLTIRHYIGPGPSSRGMPPEAPGNIGSWIGWQIVRHYMTRHPQVSLSQLMQMKNSQKVLDESKYHPH